MSTWVNFKELRAKLNFEHVLRHYNVEVKRKGNQHHGFCPLPNHNGKKNSPSFSANLEKGIFQCFGCGAKGNVLEFASMMENVSPEDGESLRTVALRLQDRFCSEVTKTAEPRKRELNPEQSQTKGKLVVVNAPLDFELKDLDYDHPYLPGRGFSRETINHFGLGFCARGYFKDRIAIPLFDHNAKLVGYAGRVVDDETITEKNPRYLLPGRREREGHIFDFRKSLFLYNGFRIKAPVDDLIIVEGFTSVWWLHQHGISNVVATMGVDCSPQHTELIVSLVKSSGRVWIMPDGNEAGLRLGESLLLQVSPYRLMRWVKLEDRKQPTDCSSAELRAWMSMPAETGKAITTPSSIKERLTGNKISNREAIIELAQALPCLRTLNLTIETWNPDALDSRAGKFSSGERAALQFLLHVWNPFQKWQMGSFNIGVLDTWDRAHRNALAQWVSNPWWC
jgi:DNA primase